ncbi:MAG: hypothetical protein NTW21_24395 [Verrucomicrobia bacterium]|nr:hypothetical protein [Verrucomicrobiota bacterium]
MKTMPPDNPIRNCLKHLAHAMSPVILACCLASQAQAQWTYSPWTGDADSGITSASPYTVAVNCGGPAATVNGVAFQASATSGANFSLGGGITSWGPGGSPNISGGSLTLALGFFYNGTPRTVTLTNLTPGATYETSLFSFGWEASGRSQTFASGSDSIVVDQDFYGNQNGIRIAYTFVADSSGSKVLTITPGPGGNGGSFHMCALANRQVSAGSPQAKILVFGPGATIGPVSANAAAISWTVPYGSNPVALSPTFTTDPAATCTVGGILAASGSTQDFTNPVHYIVKASDFATSGKTTDYTVTVTVTPASPACDITSFGINVAGSSAVITDIDFTTGTVDWRVPYGTPVATLAPSYTLSAGATCTRPNPGIPTPALSTTTPVPYLIHAEDGFTTKTYDVTVTVAPPPPGGVTGLALWLDASAPDTMTLDGSTVNEWRDKLGSTAKMTRANGAPTVVASGIGTIPTVHFTSGSSMGDGVNHAAPVTIFYVSRQTGGSNARVLSATGNNWLLGYHGGQRDRCYFEGWVCGEGDGIGGSSDTNPHLYTATIGGSGQNSTVWAEGVQIASNQNGTQGPNNLNLGSSSFNEYSDCDISEVLVYHRILNSTELGAVGEYLTLRSRLHGAHLHKPCGLGAGCRLGCVKRCRTRCRSRNGDLHGHDRPVQRQALRARGSGTNAVMPFMVSGRGGRAAP